MKSIIFDFDGTLSDSMPSIWKEYRITSYKLGLKPVEMGVFTEYVGLPWRILIEKIHPEIDVDEFSRVYRGEMESPKPIKGVKEVLRRLMGRYKLAILTSRGGESLKIDMGKIGLDEGFFEIIFHKHNSNYHKPEGKALEEVVNALGSLKNECVYIGDSVIDAETARQFGCEFIGVLSGGTTEKRFMEVGVSRVIETVSDLESLL